MDSLRRLGPGGPVVALVVAVVMVVTLPCLLLFPVGEKARRTHCRIEGG